MLHSIVMVDRVIFEGGGVKSLWLILVVAYIVMACAAMACIVMANIVMADGARSHHGTSARVCCHGRSIFRTYSSKRTAHMDRHRHGHSATKSSRGIQAFHGLHQIWP